MPGKVCQARYETSETKQAMPSKWYETRSTKQAIPVPDQRNQTILTVVHRLSQIIEKKTLQAA